MVSLPDITPQTEDIEVRGKTITVRGVGITLLGQILSKSDDLQKAWNGVSGVNSMGLMLAVPDACRSIMAAALTGDPNDDKALELIENLNFEDQLDLMEATIKASFPRGITPFIDRAGKVLLGMDNLSALLKSFSDEALAGQSGKVLDSNTPLPSTSLSPPNTISTE